MKNARTIRETKGLSLYDVSAGTGIIPETLRRFEVLDGLRMRPKREMALAAFYGCTINDLVQLA